MKQTAMAFDSTMAIDAARREVALCQRQLEIGSSPDFWRRRLDLAAKQLEAAAAMSQTEDERLIDACEDGGPGGRSAGLHLIAQRDAATSQADGWLWRWKQQSKYWHEQMAKVQAAHTDGQAPIPMRLPCPTCGALHVDVGRFATHPHHTHACQHCGAVWRPALVNTVGVRFLPGFKNEEEG